MDSYARKFLVHHTPRARYAYASSPRRAGELPKGAVRPTGSVPQPCPHLNLDLRLANKCDSVVLAALRDIPPTVRGEAGSRLRALCMLRLYTKRKQPIGSADIDADVYSHAHLQ